MTSLLLGPTMARSFGITSPRANVASLQRTTLQLKEAVESLLGQRGTLIEDVVASLSSSGGGDPGDLEARVEALETTTAGHTAAIINLDNRLDVAEVDISQNTSDIGALTTRVTNIEAEQITQNGRLDSIETEQVTQNGRLDAIEVEQITQNNRLTSLESRMDTAENQISNLIDAIYFILDGTHAFGYVSSRYRWSPPSNSGNGSRLSFDSTAALSNITQPNNFSFSPQYEGDFHILVTLRFAPDSSGDEWNIQGFDNGTPIGSVFEFKPDEVSGGEQAMFTFQTAGYFHIGDVVDLRLWPNDSGKAGWIEGYTYQITGLGLIDHQFDP